MTFDAHNVGVIEAVEFHDDEVRTTIKVDGVPFARKFAFERAWWDSSGWQIGDKVEITIRKVTE